MQLACVNCAPFSSRETPQNLSPCPGSRPQGQAGAGCPRPALTWGPFLCSWVLHYGAAVSPVAPSPQIIRVRVCGWRVLLAVRDKPQWVPPLSSVVLPWQDLLPVSSSSCVMGQIQERAAGCTFRTALSSMGSGWMCR